MNLTCLIPKADLLSDPADLLESDSAEPSMDNNGETADADDPEIIPDICMPVKARSSGRSFITGCVSAARPSSAATIMSSRNCVSACIC